MRRRQLENDDHEAIAWVADNTLILKGELADKSISVLMREVDAKKSKSDYAASKYPEHYRWLDIEARNMFHQGVGAGTLKYVTRYNHYEYRDKQINAGLVEDRCPRYQQRES